MAKILCIETSTEVCSVVIAVDGKIADYREDRSGQNHAKLLTSFIDDLLKAHQQPLSSFNAVAVSGGPGSYTGLRIGVSVAKGICFGASLPLIAISPLEAMASCVRENSADLGVTFSANDYFIPMIDARRMEVYAAVYNVDMKEIKPVEAVIVDAGSFGDLTEGRRLFYFGNGAAKCREVLKNEHFTFVASVIASSKNMASVADRKFAMNDFVDVAYFEPFYLKEFVATVAKNSVLPPAP